MYSAHNEGKSVVSERFVGTLKSDKYMTSISKNVYIDTLDDIIYKYNSTYHRVMKMKLIVDKASTYIDFDVESNNKNSKYR